MVTKILARTSGIEPLSSRGPREALPVRHRFGRRVYSALGSPRARCLREKKWLRAPESPGAKWRRAEESNLHPEGATVSKTAGRPSRLDSLSKLVAPEPLGDGSKLFDLARGAELEPAQ